MNENELTQTLLPQGFVVYAESNCTHFPKVNSPQPTFDDVSNFTLLFIKKDLTCDLNFEIHMARDAGYDGLLFYAPNANNETFENKSFRSSPDDNSINSKNFLSTENLKSIDDFPVFEISEIQGENLETLLKNECCIYPVFVLNWSPNYKEMFFQFSKILLQFFLLVAIIFMIIILGKNFHGCIKSRQILHKLEKISTRKYSSMLLHSYDSETCPICLDVFAEDDDVTVLPCGHEYHQVCLLTWNRLNCPLCNTFITTSE